MASTMIGTSSPNAAKVWSTKVSEEALRASYFNMFVGKDEKSGRLTEDDAGSLITVKNELKKNKGDTITLNLRAQLQGDGVIGGETLEGNEESLVWRNDSVKIDVQRHAVRSDQGISEQRVPFSIRSQGKSALRDWWKETLDQTMVTVAAGDVVYNASSNRRFKGNNTITAPTYLLKAGNLGTETLVGADSSAVITLKRLNAMKAYGINVMRMRPVNTPKGPRYVVFLHDEHELQLRNQAGSDSWLAIQQAAMAGGKYADNPLLSGALGEYNEMLFIKSERLPRGINAAATDYVDNTRRLVMCGAQALVAAWGMDHDDSTEATYTEKKHDYDEEIGMAMKMMWGIKAATYSNESSADPVDYGRLVACTYTEAISAQF